jgi:hypothetical protein
MQIYDKLFGISKKILILAKKQLINIFVTTQVLQKKGKNL